MFVILGLIILIAAVVVAVAGIFANAGSAHDLTGGFSVFGYHVTGSTGTLFLYGIIVGAVALLGLALLLAGAGRSSAARHAHRQSRRETAVVDRDDLIDQRDPARTHAESQRQDDSAQPRARHRNRHWFGHHAAPR